MRRTVTPQQALERLREGNRRFTAGESYSKPGTHGFHPSGVVKEQRPFAIILGCSDSRVPLEMVFDRGPGDLFVIRVAGNVVAPTQFGSVEFAALHFGVPLVVVLGHSHCGAVKAAIEELQQSSESLSPNLHSITDRVRPSVEGLLKSELQNDQDALLAAAVRTNIEASVNQLRHGSEILKNLIKENGLIVVGAEYSLETGIVEFI